MKCNAKEGVSKPFQFPNFNVTLTFIQSQRARDRNICWQGRVDKKKEKMMFKKGISRQMEVKTAFTSQKS